MTAYEALEASAGAIRRRFHRWEIGVDGAIHAVAIVAGCIGAVILLLVAARRGGAADVTAVAVYSVGLLAMLACSAAYNLGRFTRHVDWLRGLDQTGILLMIAGTYTPFTLLDLSAPWSWSATSIVWSLAAFGVLLRLFNGRLFRKLAIGLYLALGWFGGLALIPFGNSIAPATFILLATGGALYTIGIVFHVWERLPFQSAIWHLFVVAAAAVHFAAVTVSVAAVS